MYPRTGDIPEAWAPRSADAGVQHITVSFGAAIPVRAVVWLATFGPGTVVRVDDVSNPSGAVTLWTGTDPSAGQDACAVEPTLAAPRTIQALRLYLDTTYIPGWNELDAIGLIP